MTMFSRLQSAVGTTAVTIGAALLGLLPFAPPLGAHPITVDGSTSDWPLTGVSIGNLGSIARGPEGIGEYIWNDVLGDTRADQPPLPRSDIRSLRITGSRTHLSFLIVMADLDFSVGEHVVIAIDLDQISGHGGEHFGPDLTGTFCSPEVGYEYLVTTRIASLFKYAETYGYWSGQFTQDSIARSPSTDAIEFSIPWSRLGLTGPPVTPIRFAVVSYNSDGNGLPTPFPGSWAVDCVTNYGDPRTSGYPDTRVETTDFIVDYFFDVWFSSSGEPIAPLLVSEAIVDAPGNESLTEWFEVANRTTSPLSLDGVKLGDEETPDETGFDAMYAFPSGFAVPAAGSIVFAKDAASFQGLHGVLPDFEFGADPAVPNLFAYTPWMSGSGIRLDNAGDEVLLLDRSDTVLDVLVFGTGSWPGVGPHSPVPPEGHTLARSPADLDHDDCQADFVDLASPTPRAVDFLGDLALTGFSTPWLRRACVPTRVSATLRSDLTATAFRIGVYLSSDSVVTAGDLLIGSTLVAMGANQTATHEFDVSVPEGILGDLYAGVVLDDLGQDPESDELNNSAKVAMPVVVPTLQPAADVRNDQGRFVRLHWLASSRDVESSPTPILQYEVFRRIDPLPVPAATRRAPPAPSRPTSALLAGWEFVAAAPAHAESEYQLVVPTLVDSNAVSGAVPSVFFVRAATATPAIYFDSCPDSGWSVDNLAPATPAPFTAVRVGGSTALHWGANREPDLAVYRLYRGASLDFVPGSANLVAETPDTGYVDVAAPAYYKLSAVDRNGNESAFATLVPTEPVGVLAVPIALALGRAMPNPASREVALALELPVAARVRLEVLDAAGRRVRAFAEHALGPGRHRLAWDLAGDGGLRLASGRYFLRVRVGREAFTRAVTILD
jgi:hypothetical protein